MGMTMTKAQLNAEWQRQVREIKALDRPQVIAMYLALTDRTETKGLSKAWMATTIATCNMRHVR